MLNGMRLLWCLGVMHRDLLVTRRVCDRTLNWMYWPDRGKKTPAELDGIFEVKEEVGPGSLAHI